MHGKIKDISGLQFGNLTVVEEAGRADNKVLWLCKCSCGNTKLILGKSLRLGKTKSCGCLHKRQLTARNVKHNKSKTLENYIWLSMKQRCYNPKNKDYKNYGGRGITICSRWLDSFENFLEDMKIKPFKDAQIDRINNDGNYEPTNCRWVTKQENHMNRRCTKK